MAILLMVPLAFAATGPAMAAMGTAPLNSGKTSKPVSVTTPAYYYDYKTHSSATVSTSSISIGSTSTTSSPGATKTIFPSGTKTTSSTGTTTPFGATTTIYAAIRTDGIAGSGTKADPYDASTEAKFDAILANLLKANGAQRTTLSLGAGTYTVTPIRVNPTSANPAGYVCNIPGNLEIIGAGVNETTIRAGIVPTASSTYWVLAAFGTTPGDYFENLTIDCNIQNQTVPDITIDGIQDLHIAGGATQTLAASIHMIDGGNRAGDPGYSEWFGIQLSDFQEGSVCEVTQCIVDHYQGNGGCTAVSATDLITNNSVTLNNNDPDGLGGHGYVGGFQNAFSPAHTVSGNTCAQCTWGIYTDLDDQEDENIENNVFNTLYGGLWIYTWSSTTTLQDIYVHNNTITKTYEAAVILGNSATQVTNSNLYVYNNTITTNATATLASDNLVYVTAAQNSEVYGNTFSVSPGSETTLPTGIALNSCNLSTIAWYNNKFSNGTVIPGPGGTVDHALSTASVPAN
ncbi:MAG TPA: hypothetical protein VHY09_11610 [Candidatus Methylacidiphilales bacterium]|nr:hypothetical protein [Candidatus Methylacidiphilales bacterium]